MVQQKSNVLNNLRLSHAVLYFHLRPVCLATLCHKMYDFSEQIKNKVYVLLFLQILPEIFLILMRIHRDVIINVRRSSYKVPVIFVRFYWKTESSR